MHNKLAAAALIILFMVTACSKEQPRTVGDEVVRDLSVESVIQSREPEISAGNEAFLRGDYTAAIQYYETGIKQNRSVAYYNMGVSHYLMRNITESERYFRLAVEEDPGFDEALINLVAVLAEQEKSIEAEQFMSRLVNTEKTARVYVDMANLSIKNGSPAKAKFYYDKAISIDNQSQFVLSNYANFLISLGEINEGERILNRLENRDFTVLYNLAYISWLGGNEAAAYEYAGQASYRPEATEEGLNKLAALFSDMKRYFDESETLRKLIMWNPKKEYRIRLVLSYLRSLVLDRAHDESVQLLRDYPNDVDATVARYRVMIARGEIAPAGRFIAKAYENNRVDKLLYHTVRHISLYDYDPSPAGRMVASSSLDTPFMNLARAVYNIRMDRLDAANTAINKVPENIYNDYYIYKSFLTFKDGQLQDAEALAMKIDETNPEYFWYHFVLAWDLRKPQRVLELINSYREDYIITSRVPMFAFRLTPVVEDMTFSFPFKGTGSDMAAMLMYPLFIEPAEMHPFLALGYRLIAENEGDAAIREFERSIEYSDAVIKNNEAVAKILEFDYSGAFALLTEVEEPLGTNPFFQYNMGLVNYFMGNLTEANDRYIRAIRLNRYMVPAYVGRGLVFARSGDSASAEEFFESAVANANEYMGLEHTGVVMPMIAQARYLAQLAIERPDRILTAANQQADQDNFVKAVAALANFMMNPQPQYLDEFFNTNIFHSTELRYLLDLSGVPVAELQEQPSDDSYTLMMAKYITAMRKKSLNESNIQHLLNNQTVLMDLVQLATLLRDRQAGLRYLQVLSRIDIRYVPQYKASLYYFMWLEDYVNAEASYTALERLNATDKQIQYYMMLYFLLNYNQRRFATEVDTYIRAYPTDYRGGLMNAMRDLQDGNVGNFLGRIETLLSNEPYLFNKMPLEIDIVRF